MSWNACSDVRNDRLNPSFGQTLHAVALAGATGTGKSALALRIAEACGSSIICCDSMQVYRQLDTGTAKPDADEQARAPHFMLDCCTLPDTFSAARWGEQAALIIRQENQAGRMPLIVGGSGLYLRALINGFSDIPAISDEVRRRIETLQQQHGTAALHAILKGKDPAMAARLEPGDTQRIMRALCVFEGTGKPLSAWQSEHNRNKVDIHCPVFVLDVPRDALRQRIDSRFQNMLDAGWLAEVRWLHSLRLPDTHPAMRAVGYRQLLAHVRGECPLPEAVNAGMTATRRYAKRQCTWFAHQTPDAIRGDAKELETRIRKAVS